MAGQSSSVLVIGGGAVGLATALNLRRFGVAVMLVVAQGISFSDTMLVTPSGAERLGSLDRRLTIVQ